MCLFDKLSFKFSYQIQLILDQRYLSFYDHFLDIPNESREKAWSARLIINMPHEYLIQWLLFVTVCPFFMLIIFHKSVIWIFFFICINCFTFRHVGGFHNLVSLIVIFLNNFKIYKRTLLRNLLLE